MNNDESCKVNTLLIWMLGIHRQGLPPVTEFDAMQAAAYLAGRADRQLGAGLTGRDVERLWSDPPRRPAQVGNGDVVDVAEVLANRIDARPVSSDPTSISVSCELPAEVVDRRLGGGAW